DPAGVQRIIEERSAISVELICADMKLERRPDEPNAILRRFNRLTLRVTKHRPVSLSEITIPIKRVGSKYGEDNVMHERLSLADVPVGVPTDVILYAFDFYNAPFAGITVEYSTAIDLTSPKRTLFRELKPYL